MSLLNRIVSFLFRKKSTHTRTVSEPVALPKPRVHEPNRRHSMPNISSTHQRIQSKLLSDEEWRAFREKGNMLVADIKSAAGMKHHEDTIMRYHQHLILWGKLLALCGDSTDWSFFNTAYNNCVYYSPAEETFASRHIHLFIKIQQESGYKGNPLEYTIPKPVKIYRDRANFQDNLEEKAHVATLQPQTAKQWSKPADLVVAVVAVDEILQPSSPTVTGQTRRSGSTLTYTTNASAGRDSDDDCEYYQDPDMRHRMSSSTSVKSLPPAHPAKVFDAPVSAASTLRPGVRRVVGVA